MKQQNKKIISCFCAGLALGTGLLMTGCAAHRTESANAVADSRPATPLPPAQRPGNLVQARRPVIVYKTRKDYAHLVPVTLDDARSQLSSYPDPRDVGEFSLPIPLGNGYLLDRRGISANSAFTSYTYSAYSQLPKVPSQQELLKSIVDKYPLTELWDCSIPYRARLAEVQQSDKPLTEAQQIDILNSIISDGFKGCRPLVEIDE